MKKTTNFIILSIICLISYNYATCMNNKLKKKFNFNSDKFYKQILATDSTEDYLVIVLESHKTILIILKNNKIYENIKNYWPTKDNSVNFLQVSLPNKKEIIIDFKNNKIYKNIEKHIYIKNHKFSIINFDNNHISLINMITGKSYSNVREANWSKNNFFFLIRYHDENKPLELINLESQEVIKKFNPDTRIKIKQNILKYKNRNNQTKILELNSKLKFSFKSKLKESLNKKKLCDINIFFTK